MSHAAESHTDGVLERDAYRLEGATGTGLLRVLLIVGGVAGAATLGLALFDPAQFFFSWWTSTLFVLSLSLGALFWLMLHHLVGATWSVVLRRLLESFALVAPLLAVAVAIGLVGVGTLFAWTDETKYAQDHLWQAKRPYLNVVFFLARAAGYFVVWGLLAWRFTVLSRRQERDGGTQPLESMARLSAPGMILLGITTTFAAFDWIMSLDFHWFSTIFGVYFWAGSFIGSLAALTTVVVALRNAGWLTRTITVEHLHDLGKLLFSFTIFWAYIAFSQYFLIWYGNIPEETIWYLHRLEGSWHAVSLALAIGHFAVPFFLLLTRQSKRTPLWMGFVALWILAFHWLDLHWQVMPTLHHHGFHPHLLDLTTLLSLAGLAGAAVTLHLRRTALVPVSDPKLDESIRFHNV